MSAGWEGNIKLKRVYDSEEDSDGLRVLATRYWPRGVHRSAVHEYHSSLAPSRDLIAEYKRGDITWPVFEARYREELNNEKSQEQLARLRAIAHKRVITLLCFCKDERDCHRTLLRAAIINAREPQPVR